jgi:hypothetical protein
MVEDIRSGLQALQLWRISYVRREGNCVAHFLSKFAVINFVDKQWIYESLECMLDIVSMEQGALYGCDN